jgi:hypothetical protein
VLAIEKPDNGESPALQEARAYFADCYSRPGYCWGSLLRWSVTPRCSVSFSSIRAEHCKTLAMLIAADFDQLHDR